MATTWSARFQKFFLKNSAALAEVLDVPGAREGWIQAEAYRHFRPAFDTFTANTERVRDDSHGKFDFSSEGSQPLLAELKIIGSQYQSKCITGGAGLPALARRPSILVRQKDKELNCLGWGLIPDYFRLRNQKRRHEKLLILVADVKPTDTSRLADVLRRIEFDAPVVAIPLARGFVKIWTLA